MSRKNKLLAEQKRIASVLSELPRIEKIFEFLPGYLPTDDQLEYWAGLKSDYSLVAMCWRARVKGQDNPLYPMLESGEIDRWHFDYFWRLMNYHWTLWELVQGVEPFIKEAFRRNQDAYPFKGACELFICILDRLADHRAWIPLKDHHEVSYGKRSEALNLAVKKDLNKIELKRIESLRNEQVIPDPYFWFWFHTVIAAGKHLAKSSLTIRDTMEDFKSANNRIAEMRTMGNRKRPSSTWNQRKSFAWINREIYLAGRGGGYNTRKRDNVHKT